VTEAYIYDAVRTPRGKGRKDGSLHEVTPTRLAVTALQRSVIATSSTRIWSTTSCWAA